MVRDVPLCGVVVELRDHLPVDPELGVAVHRLVYALRREEEDVCAVDRGNEGVGCEVEPAPRVHRRPREEDLLPRRPEGGLVVHRGLEVRGELDVLFALASCEK